MIDNGFIFDYSKCVGCHACLVGCYNENKTEPPLSWRQINQFNKKKIPLAGSINLSIACNHCEIAPCLNYCPAKAYKREESTGAVIHQPEKCIGCKYCTWACPFDAPKYNPTKGIVEKCHLCNHRIEQGLKPACAVQCPTSALSFGVIEPNDNERIWGIPETNNKPRLKVLNHAVHKNIPFLSVDAAGLKDGDKNLTGFIPDEKIHPIAEWPLVIFTYIFSFLSGWIFYFIKEANLVYKFIFIGLGVAGILLSAFHLGRPLRAARSILNIKGSWLSREILLSGLFFGSSFVFLFISNSFTFLAITSLLSLMLLLSIEMVYSIALKKYNTIVHSANTVLTATLFAFYFAGLLKMIALVIVVKALLYLYRKKEGNSIGIGLRLGLVAVRFFIGLIYPLAIIFFQNPPKVEIILVCLLVGEIIDRFEYYENIYIITPERVLFNIFRDELKK